jgi:hypothetical protein
MAVEQNNPAEPRKSAEMDLKGGADTTQLSREGSNEPSSTGEAPLVKRNWYQQLWDSLKTPGSAMQIITAALLAIAIGLAVSTTVSDIPEAVPVILEIPGSLWLRALRATGELDQNYHGEHCYELLLMMIYSVTIDRCRHDPCCTKSDDHGERWWKAGQAHNLVVRGYDDSRHHHQHHSR